MMIRILHVEDEVQHHLLTRAFLTRGATEFARGGEPLETDVIHATTLRDACMHLRSVPFDVVMLDLHLADAHGPTSLERIREIEADVPIVVVSSHLDPQTVVDWTRAGAVDCIDKSHVDPERLMAALVRATRQRWTASGDVAESAGRERHV